MPQVFRITSIVLFIKILLPEGPIQFNMPVPNLTTGNIQRAILRMTFLLIPGMISLVILNLTDTFFVARLGTDPLTGISFTFPIIFLVGQASLGLGTGLTASAAAAIGRKRHHLARAQSSIAITLTFTLTAFLIPILILIDRPILKLLGANNLPLELAESYMTVWFIGIPFFVTTIIANAAIRATGDTWSSSIPMIVAAIINVVLDPLLIFGLLFFPKLGITGAAVATVFSRFIALLIALHFLYHKSKLLGRPPLIIKHIIYNLRQILHPAIPTTIMKTVLALSISIVTAIIASFSEDAVAAYGVGARFQAFFALPTVALSIVILAFASQNHAAKQHHRVKIAFRFTHQLAIAWGIFSLILLNLFAVPLTNLFTQDPEVHRALIDFLRIAPLGYAQLALVIIISNELVGIGRPYAGATIGLLKHVFLYALLIYLGGLLLGIPGLFWGMVATNTIIAIIAAIYLRLTFKPSTTPQKNILMFHEDDPTNP
ncbi:MATE family efflux transporter [Poriferisphaera sp. WC338]|uniref:MATE family efflux transporter n=1 Tax=Poriferisphaera sp. WC338 TaxID=3425129 RepID=UPI003D815A81